MAGDNVLDAVLSVFDMVAGWFPSMIDSITGLFWSVDLESGNTGSLTFLGVLAVAGLAISVIFLVIGVISNFLHFRG